MATGTGPFEAQDILNKAFKNPGTSQDSDPAAHVVQPAYRTFTLHSGSITGSGTGTWTTGLGGYKVLDVYLRMTTGTGTVSTMDVFVESRLDGTNAVGIGAFSQITSANAGTQDQGIRFSIYAAQATLLSGVSSALRADPGAGSARQIGWGDDLRIRRDVSGGTTSPNFNFTVTVNAHS